MQITKLFFSYFTFLFIPIFCLAQKKKTTQQSKEKLTSTPTYSGVWKKRVLRTVYLKEQQKGTPFAKILFDAVNKGQLAAYSPISVPRYQPLTHKQFEELTITPPDTTLIDSPKISRQFIKIIYHEFDVPHISKFRILEDWTYYPAQRKTIIQIVSIAPALDIVSADGDYRGTRNTFFVKWKDIQPLQENFRKTEPGNCIDNLIWEDYFKDSSQVREQQAINYTSGKAKSRRVKHITDLRTRLIEEYESYDDPRRHLLNRIEDNDSIPLSQAIYHKALAGGIYAYPDARLSGPMSIQDLMHLTVIKPDTQIIIDPITGQKVVEIIQREFGFDAICKYNIEEKWLFDPVAGKTEISYTAIAPVKDIIGDAGDYMASRSLFWVRYPDVIDILDHYSEYHPFYTIERQLWEDRFKEWRWSREKRNN